MSEALELEAIQLADFSTSSSVADGKLAVALVGTGDVAAIEPLGAYLQRAHGEAARLGVSEVTCDFRKLTFMNSSCFKAFVVWIDTVKNAERPYKIRFLTDPAMHWQRRSLEALRRLAMNVVTVEGA
jgi:hypothetical protein